MPSDIKQEIEKIRQRNLRVETDKAWETSITRKIIIFLATYLVIALFLLVSKIPDPWLNALIPSIAFLLSTLTLPFFKDLWKKYLYKTK